MFTEHAFPEHSKEIMKIYAQMISNYYSISKQKEFEQQLFNETVEALVSAIEIKDTYTEGHGKRVRDLTAAICKSLSLPMEDQKKICLAALLHDIGKIGIPTEILNKPDRLTGEEYEIVKAHPEKATHVLGKIGSFTEILDIVKHHHEYHNGQGYPSGLSGSNIPLGSRIILIADAYDAMTSKRAYRESMSIDEAKAELSRNAGSQFNPELVNQVLRVLA
jgi:polar amino acid transport system substrate-binding protein